ncbi:MAG: NUDIX hydrolase [bacterium]|nr:NUDIX hydrolase [bacterium]
MLLELHPIDSKTASSHKFKLAVITMILSKTAGNAEILYQTRTRQPFMGRQEIIGGGIRRGESVVTAAKRRLKEEAGLEADFRIFGLLRKMRFSDDHRLYSDILYHVCLSTEYRGILIGENEFGENYWMPLDNAIRIEMTAPYGSKKFGEILKQLHEVDEKLISLFYIEEQYTQNIY